MNNRRIMASIATTAFVMLSSGAVNASGIARDIKPAAVEAAKIIPMHRYLSSVAAARAIEADPDILFVDVRDPVEIALSGHPAPVDAIVPFRVQSEKYDSALQEFTLVRNAGFVEQMTALLAEQGLSRSDTIFLTCGSGMRSAEAVRALVKAGYTDVWHLPEGYEGDDKPGMNTQNAWSNAGLPWSDRLVAVTPWVKAIN